MVGSSMAMGGNGSGFSEIADSITNFEILLHLLQHRCLPDETAFVFLQSASKVCSSLILDFIRLPSRFASVIFIPSFMSYHDVYVLQQYDLYMLNSLKSD